MGSTETRQRVIKTLASDGGLCRIAELVDVDHGELPVTRKVTMFEQSFSPFFQTLAIEEVALSPILSSSVDDIHNYLFGPSGRRALKLFSWILPILPQVAFGTEADERFLHLSSCLVTLQKVIDLNGTALILDGFNLMVTTLSETCNETSLTGKSPDATRALQCLTRIQRRLHTGNAMPGVDYTIRKGESLSMATEVPPDLPGDLSTEGSRHDNDHADFVEISIMPTAQEIQSQRTEYLPYQDPTTWHVPGPQGLLDRHFRLLREDTIGQLRDAVGLEVERLRKFRQGLRGSKQQPTTRTNVYSNPHVVDIKIEQLKGLQLVIRFDQPLDVCSINSTKRKQWWEASKRLQTGSLLCLVEAEGGTLFMSSADQFEKTPTADEAVDLKPSKQENLFADDKSAFGKFYILDVDERSIATVVAALNRTQGTVRSLVEFPGVLLQAFRPTLEVLQQMASTNDLPFSELLAPSLDVKETAVRPPAYALQEGFGFDLSSMTTSNTRLELRVSSPEDFDLAALHQTTTLDEAQARSLVNALARRLALCQGPPGTGKSFTGVALIKVLLANRTRARLGPIICVCYTNHALDQLLEHLIKDGVDKIIRIGSRSKSPLLEPLNLVTVSRLQDKTKTERRTEWEQYKAIDQCIHEINEVLRDLRRIGTTQSMKGYLQANFPDQHDALFGEDEDGFQTVHHNFDRIIPDWLQLGPRHRPGVNQRSRGVALLTESNVHTMASEERHQLHSYWNQEIATALSWNLRLAVQGYVKAKEELFRCRQELNLRCLQASHIIGVTTTGLAKNISLLRRLGSKVVVCEEAGEVLEAHTIAAFLPRVEHAILIGDHQQLRPQIQNYDLQSENPRGAKYSLDVSLFERLVAPHDETTSIRIPFDTLEVQRRMHPSIATLVRETLYPNLKDHESVEAYPEVPGLAKRLFWLDHQQLESGQDTSQGVNTSHSNDFEVEMTAALVSHLVRQDAFKSDEIAVLTPYLGQLRKLRNRLSQSIEIFVDDRDIDDLEREGLNDGDRPQPVVRKTSLSSALRIATVDNFQASPIALVY